MAYKHKDCVNSWVVSKKKHPRYVQLMKSLQLLFWLYLMMATAVIVNRNW